LVSGWQLAGAVAGGAEVVGRWVEGRGAGRVLADLGLAARELAGGAAVVEACECGLVMATDAEIIAGLMLEVANPEVPVAAVGVFPPCVELGLVPWDPAIAAIMKIKATKPIIASEIAFNLRRRAFVLLRRPLEAGMLSPSA
jgi:hypothetical protein